MEAGYTLWMFMVQREACGLRDSRAVIRDYNVPGEVQQCMGAVLVTNARYSNSELGRWAYDYRSIWSRQCLDARLKTLPFFA
jgi:hypothetical protein